MDKKTRFKRNTHVLFWHNMADELHHATKVLEEDINHHRIHFKDIGVDVKYPVVSGSYMLLAAYSLENLIKAILLIEFPEFQTEENLDKKLYTHDLVILANKSTYIKLSKVEIKILEMMTRASVYNARYPIPRHFSGVRDREFIDQEFVDTYKNLFVRLRDILSSISNSGYEDEKGNKRPRMVVKEEDGYFDESISEQLRKSKEKKEK